MSATVAKQARSVTTVEKQADEPSLLDRVLQETADQVDNKARQFAAALSESGLGNLRRALLASAAIETLEKALTPDIMARIMKLMNTRLGFITDRPKKGEEYHVDVVKRCVIQAQLQGAFFLGNEMNIIKGNCYLTKEFYQRKLRELEGLTDLEYAPGVPVLHNGRTVVRFGAKWKYNGKRDSLMDAEGKPGRVFAITTYQGDSADNIVGKATRKGLKAVYEQITGSTHTDDEDADLPEPDVTVEAKEPAPQPVSKTEEMANRVAGAKASDRQVELIGDLARSLEFTEDDYNKLLHDFGADTIEGLGKIAADEIINRLKIEIDDRKQREGV